MSVYDQSDSAKVKRIFISYSSIDRVRTSGLALLLEAMGHQVFHDHKTIKPGMQWESALQDGLDDATAVMVFWTRHAERSDWVRKEYEYFAVNYPDRILIPVLGDDTPLTELLKTRQQADFMPVVNDVLETKRRMKEQGAGAREIERAVTERLKEEGVEVSSSRHRRMLFLFLGFGWLLTLLRYPLSWWQQAGSAAVEGAAQATVGQVTVLAAATVMGVGASYPAARAVVEQALPEDIRDLIAENEALLQAKRELEQSNEELQASGREFAGMQRAIDDLGVKVDGMQSAGVPPSCISPNSFNACQADIQNARLDLNDRLDVMTGSLALIANQTAANFSRGEVTSTEFTMEPHEFGDCDAAPQALNQPEPGYPVQARQRDIEGQVIVQATIDADGKVTNVTAEGDTPVLSDAAIDTVRQWTFTTCSIGDETVPTSFQVKIDFRLHD